MKNRLEYIIFVSFSRFFRVIGINLSRKFSTFIAFFFFYFIPIRKQVVFSNLQHAFPQKKLKEIKNLAFRTYKSFAITLVEILYLPYLKRQQIMDLVECENPQLIVEKYIQGKGVILLSSHFGNWEFIAISVAMQVKIPFSVIVKPLRNPYVFEWMNRFRTKFNNEIVPLGISVRKTYQTLKDKKIVAMVADQRGPREGIRVNFFGREVSVYAGPAALALKTGAPIIYGIPVRQKNFKYRTTLVEFPIINLPENYEKKIKEISQQLANYLEKIIRENPEQWLWMHNLWKY